MGDLNGTSLLLAIILALPTALGWLSDRSRHDRKRLKKLKYDIDEFESWVTASRRSRRIHNDEFHPNGQGCIDIPDWPSSMRKNEDE